MIETKILEKNSIVIKSLLDEIRNKEILEDTDFNILNDFYYRLYLSKRRIFIDYVNAEFNKILQRTLKNNELNKDDRNKISLYNSRINL